jgi:hypothetical protein
MTYLGWLLEMTVRLAGVSFPPQQDEPRPPVELKPAPDARAAVAAPPIDPQLSYSSINPRLLDRQDLASWHEAGGDLLITVVGYDASDPAWLKLLRIGAAGVAQHALDFAAHEFGHVSSFTRAGCREVVFAPDDEPPAAWESPGVLDVLRAAFERSPAPVGVSESDWARIDAIFSGRPAAYAEFLVLTEAGGLNQEQVALARYGARLGEGGPAPLMFVPYVLGASATLRYPGSKDQSDLADYVAQLHRLGVRADVGTAKALSAFRFLSGSGLSLMGAVVEDVAGSGRGAWRPLALSLGETSQVDWPEFESYLSRYGPTLKTSFAVRLAGVELRPSYERSFAGGEHTHEAGLRARADASSWLRLLGAAFVGDQGGRWVEGGIEARPLGWLVLGASYVDGSGYTVHREIFGANLPMIEASESGVRLTLGVAWAF